MLVVVIQVVVFLADLEALRSRSFQSLKGLHEGLFRRYSMNVKEDDRIDTAGWLVQWLPGRKDALHVRYCLRYDKQLHNTTRSIIRPNHQRNEECHHKGR
jgi:hypothetical protein